MIDFRTRQQLWKTVAGNVEKKAELANTWDMPASPPPSKKTSKETPKAVVKTAAVRAFGPSHMKAMAAGTGINPNHVTHQAARQQLGQYNAMGPGLPGMVDPTTPWAVPGVGVAKMGSAEDEILKQEFGAEAPDDNEAEPVQGENVTAHVQAQALQPKVDVSGKEPPTLLTEKKAQHYALPAFQRYPLDSYDQVEKAASYFYENEKLMPPEMKREYCQNLVKRASALDIPVGHKVEAYGSRSWASPSTVKVAQDARRSMLRDEAHVEMLDKIASVRLTAGPDMYAASLGAFDKYLGLDAYYGSDIPDPYLSTFDKRASATPKSPEEADPDDSIVIGNEYLTTRKLVEFAGRSANVLRDRFGEDFVKEFQTDPKEIFDSMPRDQKLIIMRMANNSDSKLQGASTS